ncbi:MAG: YitT family protein [Bacteroidaceae bacterium]|nr:YitT family protein [Bacteroidaceae bacterium]
MGGMYDKVYGATHSAIHELGTWKFWKDLMIMTAGMLITAMGTYYFLLPGNLILGGISGLAMIVSGILASIGISMKVSTLILILNAALIIMAAFLINKEFALKNAYTALVYGPLMDLCEYILPSSALIAPGEISVMNDVWLDLCCYILIISAAQAILFRINASTGGLDIVAKILNHRHNTEMGTALTVSGAVICIAGIAVNPFRLVMTGLLGTWINGVAVDYFTASLNKRKRVCIISDRHEEIRQYILYTLDRGCSLGHLTGGFSGEDKVEIQTLLTKDEFGHLMQYMKDKDINAFITAGNVSEIYGLWKEHSRRHKNDKQ